MNWKKFNLYNNVLAWVVFALALVTYLLSISETANFWDCAEFVACDYRLEVGHPPGAPFYMLIYNVITHLAPTASQAALYANATSALLSALTILFLFWTISTMLRRLIVPNFTRSQAQENSSLQIDLGQVFAILGGSVVGALVYTFSDTFWFSAVEAEVYAFSSLCTALVIWLMLKWEERSEEAGAERWIILIAYLMGISIGVHLLNLLCLPAMALIYYYKKSNKPNLLGSFLSLLSSFALIIVMMYGIVQGVPKVAGQFDLFFVNYLGFSYNSGLYFYLALSFLVLVFSVYLAHKSIQEKKISMLLKQSVIASIILLGIPFISNLYVAIILIFALEIYINSYAEKHLSPQLIHTVQMSLLAIVVGFSSYGVILLRAMADTPMNENAPSNAFSLRTYLAREQYGSTPLFYGPTFTSRITGFTEGEDVYGKTPKDTGKEADRYVPIYKKQDPIYGKGEQMLFPRLYSRQPQHVESYNAWLGRSANDKSKPSFGDNLRFFFSYQLNYMYWRYFLWNFVGRQNDLQGDGSVLKGNAITGIAFIDEFMLGINEEHAPDSVKNNKGHNVYYALPLLLGLLGLFYQITRLSETDIEEEERKLKNRFNTPANNGEAWYCSRTSLGVQSFAILFFLFFMTGIAIVLYLNQKPLEPRERDYAYAGSFYAFSIWIGFGVAGLWRLLNLWLKNNSISSLLASCISLLIPLQMLGQNWDDHNRSGRTLARDMGINYLESCEKNAILYCFGDNDTFPLWYIQDVEGVRQDIRTINLSYLGGDWYIDQMKRASYGAKPLDLSSMKPSFYYKHEAAFMSGGKQALTVAQSLDIVNRQIKEERAIFPTELLYLAVKDTARIQNDLLSTGDSLLAERVIPVMPISLAGKRYLDRGALATLDLFNKNQFKRPIYWTITAPRNTFSNLANYSVQTGMNYQILPLDLTNREGDEKIPALRVNQMYDNVMNKFRFGGASNEHVYFDENCRRVMSGLRANVFSVLANALISEGDSLRAKQVLDKCFKEINPKVMPYSFLDLSLADACYAIAYNEQGDGICQAVLDEAFKSLEWFITFRKSAFQDVYISGDISRNYEIAVMTCLKLEKNKRPISRDYLAKLDAFSKMFGFNKTK